MENKICLDSNIIIDILKNKENILEILNKTTGEFYTTTINIFEVLNGKKSEEAHLLLNSLKKEVFDTESATIASNLFKKLKDRGNLIDARDLFIASICISKEMHLLTRNKNHFERLKKYGLKLV